MLQNAEGGRGAEWSAPECAAGVGPDLLLGGQVALHRLPQRADIAALRLGVLSKPDIHSGSVQEKHMPARYLPMLMF